MRSRRNRTFILTFISPLLAALMLTGLIGITLTGDNKLTGASSAHAAGVVHPVEVTRLDVPAAPPIQPSLRISIPFGFAANFPLDANGQEVLVKGHGSCSDAESFTVAVTVTHDATGNMAYGELTDSCSGETTRQAWQLTAVALSDPLPLGPAESCGLVQTDDGDAITDDQAWCVDVLLGDYLFLPVITNEE
jgi:hypothetical protein